jgi:hypothetical protein
MWFFRKNILSNQAIKARSDRLMKQALRDARKRIKKGELVGGHHLSLYLHTIDERYTHIKADVHNAVRVYNYAKVRGEKMAETRQLLEFFSQDVSERDDLFHIVAEKAKQAGRDDFKHEKLSPIDLTKLKDSFESLVDKEKKNAREN